MNSGNSSLNPTKDKGNSGYYSPQNGGGNSGCVVSPAPGLGLSAYQNPNTPVKNPHTKQGV